MRPICPEHGYILYQRAKDTLICPDERHTENLILLTNGILLDNRNPPHWKYNSKTKQYEYTLPSHS